MTKIIQETHLNAIIASSAHSVKLRYESFVFLQSESYRK